MGTKYTNFPIQVQIYYGHNNKSVIFIESALVSFFYK